MRKLFKYFVVWTMCGNFSNKNQCNYARQRRNKIWKILETSISRAIDKRAFWIGNEATNLKVSICVVPLM